MRSSARRAAIGAVATLLAGCGGGAETPRAATPGLPGVTTGASGDAAAVRYDAVGYASWYGEELAGRPTALGIPFDPAAISAAHRTLPLGSHAEVTSLASGRVILLRITDRGPHRGDREIDLSRGAAALLGASDGAVVPVRVRSVIAAPADAAALAAGRPAAERLDAPAVLLRALRRDLPGGGGDAARAGSPPGVAAALPVPGARGYVVQVAAFSSEARARALADRLRGSVRSDGGLHRVRLGPFDDAGAAQRARDAAARQGYGDARILPLP